MNITDDFDKLTLTYNPVTDICLIKVTKPSTSAIVILGCFKLGSSKFYENAFYKNKLKKSG